MQFCCQFPAFIPYVKLVFDFSKGVMFSCEVNIRSYPIALLYVILWVPYLTNSIILFSHKRYQGHMFQDGFHHAFHPLTQSSFRQVVLSPLMHVGVMINVVTRPICVTD